VTVPAVPWKNAVFPSAQVVPATEDVPVDQLAPEPFQEPDPPSDEPLAVQ
jgi:hypothetical protein